jgi:hypothetical protein
LTRFQTKITTEKLAEMINEGCKSPASKQAVTALRTEMRAGFDRIETLLLAEQQRKIGELEKRLKRLEDALAVSPYVVC